MTSVIENITHPMSQSCYIVAVWHNLKTENFAKKLSKFKPNTIAKKSVLSVFFSGIGFRFFFKYRISLRESD
jgi:hypothetical protein